MKTGVHIAWILGGTAALVALGYDYKASLQHRMPKDDGHRIALTIPKPLPECWMVDMEAAEYRWAAASARLNGDAGEEKFWTTMMERVAATPCKGERWEREE